MHWMPNGEFWMNFQVSCLSILESLPTSWRQETQEIPPSKLRRGFWRSEMGVKTKDLVGLDANNISRSSGQRWTWSPVWIADPPLEPTSLRSSIRSGRSYLINQLSFPRSAIKAKCKFVRFGCFLLVPWKVAEHLSSLICSFVTRLGEGECIPSSRMSVSQYGCDTSQSNSSKRMGRRLHRMRVGGGRTSPICFPALSFSAPVHHQTTGQSFASVTSQAQKLHWCKGRGENKTPSFWKKQKIRNSTTKVCVIHFLCIQIWIWHPIAFPVRLNVLQCNHLGRGHWVFQVNFSVENVPRVGTESNHSRRRTLDVNYRALSAQLCAKDKNRFVEDQIKTPPHLPHFWHCCQTDDLTLRVTWCHRDHNRPISSNFFWGVGKCPWTCTCHLACWCS